MISEDITFFTEEEEELTNILVDIGIKKNCARILVFFKKTPSASSHDIERGTDMRQSEVSIAMRYLMDKGWIRSRENSANGNGRLIKIYELAKPYDEIMDSIENEKKNEVSSQLALVQKLQEYVSRSYDKLALSLVFYYSLFSLLLSPEEMSLIFAF